MATNLKSRRAFVRGTLALGGLVVAPSLTWAQGRLMATPGQSPGPFYPDEFPDDVDNNLVQVGSMPRGAQGQVVYVAGRVLDTGANPLPGARVEIWQCDALGRYIHSGDAGRGPSDSGFQGFGTTHTAADGRYWFRTIRPVAYTGRTPHIHFSVTARDGRRLVTQMYVAGERANAGDLLYRRLVGKAAREALTVALEPAPQIEAGVLAGRFDIVLA